MIQFISDNLIDLLTLLVSSIGLFLSLIAILKERIKLKIEYNREESFCFGFIFYEKYKMLFSSISIINLSKTPVSISKIYLKDSSGNIYESSKYDVGDSFSKNGISLYSREDESEIYIYNLESENILNNLRLDSNGVLKGYAVFFGVEPINKPTNFTLIVEASNKTFSKEITVSPLPPNLMPEHELN